MIKNLTALRDQLLKELRQELEEYADDPYRLAARKGAIKSIEAARGEGELREIVSRLLELRAH